MWNPYSASFLVSRTVNSFCCLAMMLNSNSRINKVPSKINLIQIDVKGGGGVLWGLTLRKEMRKNE